MRFCMPRTSVKLTESALNQADSKAREKGITRSDYIAAAVESVLQGTDADLNQLESKLNQRGESEQNQIKVELNQAHKRLYYRVRYAPQFDAPITLDSVGLRD